MPIATAVIAPNNMRKATRAIGPISCTPILIHRKEELQIAPRRMKTIQCLVFKETPMYEMGGNKASMYCNLEILRNHPSFHFSNNSTQFYRDYLIMARSLPAQSGFPRPVPEIPRPVRRYPARAWLYHAQGHHHFASVRSTMKSQRRLHSEVM